MNTGLVATLQQRMRCAGCALAIAVSLAAGSAAAIGNQTSPLGVNLRELRYWNTEFPTVDFFKRAGSGRNYLWLTQQCVSGCAWDTGEQALLDLDASGWPRSLPTSGPANYRVVTTILVMATDKFPAGRWTVFYDGEGALAYGFDAVRNAAASVPGRDAFDVAVARSGITLSITSTDPNRTGNYLRNIRVIPPGGTCNGDPFAYAADGSACPATFQPFTETYATRPFHPLFLSDMRPFAGLRMMHLSGTVTDQTSDWAARPHLSDASWAHNSDLGVPIEFMLDMASALNASPWLSVPARADDNFILQYARLAKSRLPGNRPIFLEYYNEAWNGAYPYNINGNWIQQQALLRWPAGPADQDFTKRINWFGMRTKQICQIWKQEFADQPGRVKCVMGAQGANPWTANQALSCPLHAAEPGGSACDSAAGMDAVAAGYYFGGHVSDPGFQTEIQTTWFNQPDGGLAKLFQEITDGSALTSPVQRGHASVALIAQQMAANAPVAANHQVAMVVYEAGNELAPSGTLTTYQNQLQDLFVRANRDPRMGVAYSAVLNHWKTVGGQMYMVFESTGPYLSARGNSPLLEYQGQPRADSVKYDTVLSFIENNPCWWPGCARLTPPGPPAIVSLTRGPGSMAIAFTPPADNGGSALAGYTAACGAPGHLTRTVSGGTSPLTVTGLTPGVLYTCTVAASNGSGAGSASAGLTAAPLALRPPMAPMFLLLLD